MTAPMIEDSPPENSGVHGALPIAHRSAATLSGPSARRPATADGSRRPIADSMLTFLAVSRSDSEDGSLS